MMTGIPLSEYSKRFSCFFVTLLTAFKIHSNKKIFECILGVHISASLVAQLVKNLPAMKETWVQSWGWEDSLEKGTATNSSIPAWRIPWPG